MIVITGAAGFIGSVLVAALNSRGENRLILVDDLDRTEKWKNLVGKRFEDYLDKDQFLAAISQGKFSECRAVFHLGACSSTTEKDANFLMQNNYRYSRTLAEWCLKQNIRLIYASSAATYGAGEHGFSDTSPLINLAPLNMYGFSKQLFDLWAEQSGALKKITGLKFFNVFGPNEYHKGEMTSVIYKAFHQVRAGKPMSLFKSYREDFTNGEQKRDFIYVRDCADIMLWLLDNKNVSGLFNIGTGKARSWNDLAAAVFSALKLPTQINYIDMPEEMRAKYQYFTEATVSKLHGAGYKKPFTSLEDATIDYVQNFLSKDEKRL